MKIAFKGFRGFGKDSGFFDLKSLTVLTGKNGSGKSTLLKLIEMMAISLSNVKTMKELVGLKINIENDLLGGKDNLVRPNSTPQMIFETRFEFYTDVYQIRINFEATDNEFKIKSIEIFDPADKITLCTWESNSIKCNCEYLNDKYKIKVIDYNLLEEYTYYHHKDEFSFANCEEYQLRYYNPEKEYHEIDSLMQYHISMRDANYIGMKTEAKEYPHYFKEAYLPGGIGSIIILDDPDESIQLDKNEIKQIVQESDYYDGLEAYQTYVKNTYEPKFDIYQILLNRYNFELVNFYIGAENKNYYEISADLSRRMAFMQATYSIDNIKGEHPQVKKLTPPIEDIKNFLKSAYSIEYLFKDDPEIEKLEPSLEEISNIIIEYKYHLLHYLTKHSSGIFEKKILEMCNIISSVKKQSSVSNVASRSYNIYENNSYSVFLREYIAKNDEDKKMILSFLKSHLQGFEIADDIIFSHESNIGFIYLKKGSRKITLMDEGSGVNNILAILLFLALRLPFKQPTYKVKSKLEEIIILEEPESNLHPNLQSKLADILSEFISKTNIHVIVETHSEYFLRKLQFLVAKQKASAKNVIIYYFDLKIIKTNLEIDFYPIEILPDGTLSEEFGPGFFDEADNLAIDLFTLKKEQKN